MSIESKIPTEEINIHDLQVKPVEAGEPFVFNVESDFNDLEWQSAGLEFDEICKMVRGGRWDKVGRMFWYASTEMLLRGPKIQWDVPDFGWTKAAQDIRTITNTTAKSLNDRFSILDISALSKCVNPEKASAVIPERAIVDEVWNFLYDLYKTMHMDKLTTIRVDIFKHGLNMKILYPDFQPFKAEDYAMAAKDILTLTSSEPIFDIPNTIKPQYAERLLVSLKILSPEHYLNLSNNAKRAVGQQLRVSFLAHKAEGEIDDMLSKARSLYLLSAGKINLGGLEVDLPKDYLGDKPAEKLPEIKKF